MTMRQIDETSAAAARDLAPSGTLRAAINLGNSVLAQPGENGGDPKGVTVDLARELACRLNLPLRLLFLKSARPWFAPAGKAGRGVAFLGLLPERAKKINISPPHTTLQRNQLRP